MKIIASIFDFSFDLSKNGLQVGNVVITKEQIQGGIASLIHIIFILIVMYAVIKIGSAMIDKSINRKRK